MINFKISSLFTAGFILGAAAFAIAPTLLAAPCRHTHHHQPFRDLGRP